MPLGLIDTPDDLNGRLHHDDAAADEIMHDLAANGLLHPITLAPHGDRYTLIAGRRRLRAASRLGWTAIHAAIRDVDEAAQATMRFLENASRSNLSPVEEAKQLATMLANEPGGIDAIAERIHRRPDWIQDRLEMIEWPDALMHAVHDKTISLGAAQRLARIQPDDLRSNRIHYAALHGINVKTAALWLQDSISGSAPESDMSLSLCLPHAEITQTETTFSCFSCNLKFPIAQTVAMRICAHCLEDVQQAQRLQAAGRPPAGSAEPAVQPMPDPIERGTTYDHLGREVIHGVPQSD